MARHAALPAYHDVVRAEWVDYNGHLRDAFYMLIFSFATDALIDQIGLDDAVRKARGRSIYTLEAHISYLHEIKEGARVRVEMRVLAHDAKRMHLYLEMFADDGDEPVAAGEQMLLHVDTRGPRSAVFDSDVQARVHALAGAQAALPAPLYAGRVIGLPSQMRK
ncbi:thioesterase family protein [Paraburkholderia sp. LEh10]|uniref:thioesterase family protein n=1 Tax=Paraburkholderia sp. LEh10 TaxID=2821353 RepID=UPI001AEA12A0|nr:thioesterase family protein [Paraburkholderia sp. LEh10]MBP0595889.1 thioesterase family protein [Paraburkholderia sp. LEh10]